MTRYAYQLMEELFLLQADLRLEAHDQWVRPFSCFLVIVEILSTVVQASLAGRYPS